MVTGSPKGGSSSTIPPVLEWKKNKLYVYIMAKEINRPKKLYKEVKSGYNRGAAFPRK